MVDVVDSPDYHQDNTDSLSKTTKTFLEKIYYGTKSHENPFQSATITSFGFNFIWQSTPCADQSLLAKPNPVRRNSTTNQ